MHSQYICMVGIDDIIVILMPWMMTCFAGFVSTFDLNTHMFVPWMLYDMMIEFMMKHV